jgi:uncharacterized alkaline shock family protein YloU
MRASARARRPSRAWRVLGWLLLVVLTLDAGVVFLLATGTVDAWELAGGRASLIEIFEPIQGLRGAHALAAASGALAVGLFTLMGALRLMAPSNPRASMHVVDVRDTGSVLIDSASVATIASQSALSVPGVVQAEARIDPGAEQAILVALKVAVHPGTAIPQVGGAVREQAREALDELVGIDILDMTVAVRVLPQRHMVRWIK